MPVADGEGGGLLVNSQGGQSPIQYNIPPSCLNTWNLKRKLSEHLQGLPRMGVFGSLSRDSWSASFPRLYCHASEVTSASSFLFRPSTWLQYLFTCSLVFLLGPLWQPAKGHLLLPPAHLASALAGGCKEAWVSFQAGLGCRPHRPTAAGMCQRLPPI